MSDMAPASNEAAAATVAECWQRGNSIAETISMARRRHQTTLSFDEVRSHFVQLAQMANAQDYGDDEDGLWDSPDDLDDDEEDEDPLINCGMMPDGTCQLAGTEECDWECPLR
jgi:hypothetical protein